jgi:integrase
MTLYRRKNSRVWITDFWKNGKRYVRSTGCKNKNDARDIENALKTDLAKAKFGLAKPKQSPPLAEFLDGKFALHVAKHSKSKATATFYLEKSKRLLDWPNWKDTPLAEITGDVINEYVSFRGALRPQDPTGTSSAFQVVIKNRAAKSISIATINGELATLRKALLLAAEWGLCPKIKVRLLPGAKSREFVLSGELERQYLEAASYPLREAAILIIDLGLRPRECVALRKEDIAQAITVRHSATPAAVVGRNVGAPDTLRVRQGKSANARRAIPLTERAACTIEFLIASFPDSPFLFPGNKGQPMNPKSISNAHGKLKKAHPEWPREMVLYTGRHTFGTRLGESNGGNPFQIKALMGHAKIATSEKYIHPQSDELTTAMARKEALDKLMRGESEKAPCRVDTTFAEDAGAGLDTGSKRHTVP